MGCFLRIHRQPLVVVLLGHVVIGRRHVQHAAEIVSAHFRFGALLGEYAPHLDQFWRCPDCGRSVATGPPIVFTSPPRCCDDEMEQTTAEGFLADIREAGQ